MAKPGVSKDEELKKYVAGKTQPANTQESQKGGSEYKRDFSFTTDHQNLAECVTPQQGDVYGNTAYIGSNFAATNPKAAVLPVCLDGHYSTYLEDSAGKLVGVGIGLGDGNGKGDTEAQTHGIAQVAHDAPQAIVDQMMTFKKADDLSKEALKKIVDDVAKAIRPMTAGTGATTTCVAARTFPTKEGNRVIGVGIGDSILVVWEPNGPNPKFTTLLPSTIHSKLGTAAYPNSYNPNDTNYCDALLGEGAILIPMSDGIMDHLPQRKYKDTPTEGYETVELDPDEMKKLLTIPTVASTPEECIRRMTQRALENTQQIMAEGLEIQRTLAKALAPLDTEFNGLNAEYTSKAQKEIGAPDGFKTQAEKDTMFKQLRELDITRSDIIYPSQKKLYDMGIAVRGDVLKVGDDIGIVGVRVPIKGVEVFRSLLKSQVTLSEKKVKAHIDDYLSLYPKNEQEQKLSELLSQREEIMQHLSQTTGLGDAETMNFYSRLNALNVVLHAMAPPPISAASASSSPSVLASVKSISPPPVTTTTWKSALQPLPERGKRQPFSAAAAAASPSLAPTESTATAPSATLSPQRPAPIVTESKLARAKAFRLPPGTPSSDVVKIISSKVDHEDKKPKR